MYDLVGIDRPNIDLNLNVGDFPRPNAGTEIENSSWQGGGKISTGMVAAARLGARGAMLGVLGDDRYGAFCLADFERHGIDTGGLFVRSGFGTSLSVVISDRETNGRCFVWQESACPPLTLEEVHSETIRARYLQNTRLLYICHTDSVTMAAVNIAKSAGAKIIIDADHYEDTLPAAMEKLDIFIGSEFVYEALFGSQSYEKSCKSLLAQGVSIAIFTLGSKGCVGMDKNGYFEVPACEVPVADTVGAGDVFHGAFAAAWLQGWGAKKAAAFSCAVSAIKCTRIGGRAGIPDMATALHFIETGNINCSEIDKRVEFYKRGIEHV